MTLMTNRVYHCHYYHGELLFAFIWNPDHLDKNGQNGTYVAEHGTDMSVHIYMFHTFMYMYIHCMYMHINMNRLYVASAMYIHVHEFIYLYVHCTYKLIYVNISSDTAHTRLCSFTTTLH